MTRLYLLALHQWHRMQLWQALTQLHSAEVVLHEAQAELERANALLAHNTRLMMDAENAVMLSGYAIDRHDRLKSLGVPTGRRA